MAGNGPITPPSYIDRVNFITFFLSNPCNFPWIVYFETLGGVIGRLVWHLLEFDVTDVIRSLFRPGGVRSSRHRGRRRRPPRRPLIPELSDVVADRFPSRQALEGREISNGVRNLWRIDGFIQRQLYYLMLFDIVLEFWCEWQSAIIRDPRSNCEGVGRALRENDSDVFSMDGWGALLFPTIRYSAGPVLLGNADCQAFTGNWLVTIAVKARPWIPDPLGTFCGVRIVHFGSHEVLDSTGRKEVFPGQSVDLVATVTLTAPFHISFQGLGGNRSPFAAGTEYYEMSAFAMQMGE